MTHSTSKMPFFSALWFHKDKSQGFTTALWILQNTLALTTLLRRQPNKFQGWGQPGKVMQGSFPTREPKVVFS